MHRNGVMDSPVVENPSYEVGTTRPTVTVDMSSTVSRPLQVPFGTNLMDLNITSLDQVINPYDYAKQYLGDDSAEGRAKYLHYLEEGKYIQQMQMAAYQNWYNSPEEVAKREREAGLNPDLIGLESGNESATASAPETSGVAALPTEEALRSQRIQNIMSIVNGFSQVAGLATSFANLSLVKPQRDLMTSQSVQGQLENIATQEALFGHGISSRLADAIGAVADGQVFDADKWFSDESNLSGLYEAFASSDTPQNKAIFQNLLRNRESLLSQANEIAAQRAKNQTEFAKSSNASHYSPDINIQHQMLSPVMDALQRLDEIKVSFEQEVINMKKEYMKNLDPAKLAELQNAIAAGGIAEAGYEEDYFTELNGQLMASYERMIKSCENVKSTMTKAIYNNLFTTYNQNPMSTEGIASSYLLLQGAHITWAEYLAAYGLILPPPPKVTLSDGRDITPIIQGGDTLTYPKRPFTLFDIWNNQ